MLSRSTVSKMGEVTEVMSSYKRSATSSLPFEICFHEIAIVFPTEAMRGKFCCVIPGCKGIMGTDGNDSNVDNEVFPRYTRLRPVAAFMKTEYSVSPMITPSGPVEGQAWINHSC